MNVENVDDIFEKYENTPNESVKEYVLTYIFTDFIIRRHSEAMYQAVAPEIMPEYIGRSLYAGGGNIMMDPFNDVLKIRWRDISIQFEMYKYSLEPIDKFENFYRGFMDEKKNPSNALSLGSIIDIYYGYYDVCEDTLDDMEITDIAIKVLEDWANKKREENGIHV